MRAVSLIYYEDLARIVNNLCNSLYIAAYPVIVRTWQYHSFCFVGFSEQPFYFFGIYRSCYAVFLIDFRMKIDRFNISERQRMNIDLWQFFAIMSFLPAGTDASIAAIRPPLVPLIRRYDFLAS